MNNIEAAICTNITQMAVFFLFIGFCRFQTLDLFQIYV